MVQDILSDMNSDEVSSINDTVESEQVARIIKSSYFEMITNKHWPHLRQLSTLKQVGDLAKPTHMKVDDNVKELTRVEYNISGDDTLDFKEIVWVEPDQFLRNSNHLNPANDNVVAIEDYSGVSFNITNDAMPRCYTSFDDQTVVFDSYDKEVEDTIQESNNRIMVFVTPSWTMSDSFVPDLPEEAFAGLLAEAKSTCFTRIKQAPDAKSEQQARRQHSWLSRKAFTVNGGIKLPDYGRKKK